MNQGTPPIVPQATLSPPGLFARIRGLNITTGLSLLVIYLAMGVVFAILTPYFLTPKNFVNIGQTLAVVGIIAIGETLVLIAGGVDISVGSVAALAGVVASLLWDNRVLPIWGCVGVGLASGALVGFLNGLIVTRLRINPLITTLGMFSMIRGLAFVLTGGQMNQLNNAQFQFLGRGDIGGVPFSLILMLVFYAFFIFVVRQTTFGRDLYAVGGNPVASRLAGIPVRRYLLLVYTLCGLLAAFGGMILASQLAAGTPQAATGLEFTVIAAVILGGTSLAGGKGTLIGSLIGVFILRTLDNGLILTNVSSYYQEVARGVVLLLAVGFDQLRLRLGRTS
ncbi:MAG: ABC transporter permease [Ardenticatenaceae bacterium]|nr:ABC transporter permease [Ardenticatenaceae bacterium]